MLHVKKFFSEELNAQGSFAAKESSGNALKKSPCGLVRMGCANEHGETNIANREKLYSEHGISNIGNRKTFYTEHGVSNIGNPENISPKPTSTQNPPKTTTKPAKSAKDPLKIH
jgi:hypothetical protein